MNEIQPWKQESVILNSQLILDNFQRWMGKPLLDRTGTPEEMAKALFEAPHPVFCHGTEADPIYNYGNRKAMELWEVSWEELTQMPSRYSAPPMDREERLQLLKTVTENGYIKQGKGIRISRTGQRFLISDFIVWNLLDDRGNYCGQAATFSKWEKID